jgi:hypothetical protein
MHCRPPATDELSPAPALPLQAGASWTGLPAPQLAVLLGLLFGLALLLIAASPALGQAEDSDSWKGRVAVGLDASGGNTSLVIFRVDFGLAYLRTDRAEFDFSGAWRYGESQGNVIERQVRGSLKLDLQPQADWTPFIYTNAFRDPVRRRLDLRMETGGGLKHTFSRWADGKASLSAAAVWAMENYTRVPDQPDGPDNNEGRISWRSKVAHAFAGGRASVEQVSFYQPVWSDWGDYLFVAETELETRVVGSLSLLVRHEYLYDSTPVEGVRRDDWALSVSFEYAF